MKIKSKQSMIDIQYANCKTIKIERNENNLKKITKFKREIRWINIQSISAEFVGFWIDKQLTNWLAWEI